MILKLYKGKIYIKDNESPEPLNKCKITYEYELGTNMLEPMLIIGNKVFIGDNIEIDLDQFNTRLDMTVLLRNSNLIVYNTYKGSYPLYKTFTVGDEKHINVYKALVEANAEIKRLKEEGELI